MWEVGANRAKMQGTALTALEPLVFPRISTEIGLVLAPAVDGMLSQPSPAPWELNVWPRGSRSIHGLRTVALNSTLNLGTVGSDATLYDGCSREVYSRFEPLALALLHEDRLIHTATSVPVCEVLLHLLEEMLRLRSVSTFLLDTRPWCARIQFTNRRAPSQ